MSRIRVLSLDVTGTLLIHRYPIMQSYLEIAHFERLPNPPSLEELSAAYKRSYKYHSLNFPHFGKLNGLPAREWWKRTARMAYEDCGKKYTDREFERYFRRVYQYYGSPDAYEILPDAEDFLKWTSSQRNSDGTNRFILGITSNTPLRVIETVLPMMKLHNYFRWFICSEEQGVEKPSTEMFDEVFQRSIDELPSLSKKEEILHIGDSLAADYCGAKAYGFQSILLDRSGNPRVTVYQDWLKGPDYSGKTVTEIESNTVGSFQEVQKRLASSL